MRNLGFKRFHDTCPLCRFQRCKGVTATDQDTGLPILHLVQLDKLRLQRLFLSFEGFNCFSCIGCDVVILHPDLPKLAAHAAPDP